MHCPLQILQTTACLFLLPATVQVTTALTQQTFEIVAMIPMKGAKHVGQEVVRAAYLALNDVLADPGLVHIRAGGYNFNISIVDTECDTGVGLAEVVGVVTRLSDMGKAVDAFVGPLCDNVCETAGLLATHWEIPMISFGCEEHKLSDRKLYPTFLRTTDSFGSMVGFLEDVLINFSWDRVMIVSAGSQVWLETEELLRHELSADDFIVFQWNIWEEDWLNISEMFKKKSKLSKIFVLCMFGSHVLHFMDAANKAGLMDGEHVFLSFDFANMGKRANHELHGAHLTGLLDITTDVSPERSEFLKFVDTITLNSTLQVHESTNHGACTHYEYGIHAGLLYDAVKLYILAVEGTLADNADPRNGVEIAKHVYNVSFEGITGNVFIRQDGSRRTKFMLHNVQDGCYLPLIRSKDNGRGITVINVTVIWPGGFLVPPKGHPRCHWDGSLCEGDNIVDILTAVVVVVIVTVIIIGLLMYWRIVKKRRDSSRLWVIAAEDLKPKGSMTKSRNMNSSIFLTNSYSKSSSHLSTSSDNRDQVFAEQYLYMGEEVAGKSVDIHLRHLTTGITQMSKEINTIMELSHMNICKFYGVCLTPGHQMSVWEYCRKGSLLDVLHNHKKYIDDIPFKVSFICDITKGLKYLHRSNRGYHGCLKSANVLVDNKWTCKLAHMAITCLVQPCNDDSEKTNYGRLLSYAPEVLRDRTEAVGSKAADVYSFGIILLEIFTVREILESFSASYATQQAYEVHKKSFKRRQKISPEPILSDPYALYDDLDPKEIYSRLVQSGPIPFRPLIPESTDGMVRTIILECWREHPHERPSIDHLSSLIRHVTSKYTSKSKSLIEQMLDKVTREADMQAQELKEERNKSDHLLFQMLPPTVADCLKKQIEVKPETFQSATVYFSDIQGFTELSSISEPLEIVNFLNNIYYRFDTTIEQYNVYKVETIGDAYVVCSGVPIKVTRHASEIATMALHILLTSQDLQVLHRPEQKLHMRIGMHSGPVAAGVVGRTMPRYCLFGDTVNTASRMESTGIAGRIQISEQCKVLLDDDFDIERREPLYVKGKGTLQTFFLNGKAGFDPLITIAPGPLLYDVSSTSIEPAAPAITV